MSIPASTEPAGAVSLPAINQALGPDWVRRGSASTQKAYEAALSFEATLVEQLSRSLTSTSGLGGESSEEGDSSSSEGGSSGASSGGGELSSLLPQALSEGVMRAGGLGLAAQMTRDLPAGDGAATGGSGA